MLPTQAVTELVESYVSQVERLLSSALDARRLTSAGAAAGGFLGGAGGRGSPAPGTAGSTAKLADILWRNLSKVVATLPLCLLSLRATWVHAIISMHIVCD